MIPSIFEYMPGEAEELFTKLADSARDDPSPEVVPPSLPSEPTVEKPPPHPYAVAAKQLLPIGLGGLLGGALGYGIPAYLRRGKPPLHPGLLMGLIGTGSAAGSILGAATNMMSRAEMDRASQDYQDYLARRAGNYGSPQVQPPPVRT